MGIGSDVGVPLKKHCHSRRRGNDEWFRCERQERALERRSGQKGARSSASAWVYSSESLLIRQLNMLKLRQIFSSPPPAYCLPGQAPRGKDNFSPYLIAGSIVYPGIKCVEFVVPAKGEAGNSRCVASRPLNRSAMQSRPRERTQRHYGARHWGEGMPSPCAGTTKLEIGE